MSPVTAHGREVSAGYEVSITSTDDPNLWDITCHRWTGEPVWQQRGVTLAAFVDVANAIQEDWPAGYQAGLDGPGDPWPVAGWTSLSATHGLAAPHGPAADPRVWGEEHQP